MEDERIIDLFFERSEQAINELSNKYGRIFMKIAINALGNISDAEECVNDAYLGIWNAIPPARPNPLLAFACKIVRNISINRYHSKGFRHSRNGYEECLDEFENFFSSSDSVEDIVDKKQISGYINDFLDIRSEIDRMIFVRRFFYMDTCKGIAEASGLSLGAVGMRLSRMKADLKKYLIKRGVEL